MSGISELLSRTDLTLRQRADFYEKRDRLDAAAPKKLAKPIAQELFDTELNYVKLLRFTVNDMMGQLEDPNQGKTLIFLSRHALRSERMMNIETQKIKILSLFYCYVIYNL